MAARSRRAAPLALALTLAGIAAAPGPAPAQQAPAAATSFLFINQERLLTGSKQGQALLAEEDRERDALRAEARKLDAAFEEEERRLTEQRPTLPPEEFRELSDAFDARVVKARRDQDERASALAQQFDQRRRQFYAQVAPILVMLMDRYGAKAIFDENSVLLADQTLNITDAVIAQIDTARAPATARGTETPATPEAAPVPEAVPPSPESPPESPPPTSTDTPPIRPRAAPGGAATLGPMPRPTPGHGAIDEEGDQNGP